MNVESLKSELQQVLDNDVVLRKEFNELKRSLSDYRNQLIMRDEDCKRLQVTIDVLNTKLVVMERDNNNYKAELTSFKELRSTIKEQLQAKQDEIGARLQEIQSLKDDLNAIAAGYEQKIDENKQAASAELERVTGELTSQISDLKATALAGENTLRARYDVQLQEITSQWESREHAAFAAHTGEIENLQVAHQQELNAVRESYESKISGLTSGSQGEIDKLVAANQSTITQMENDFNQKLESLDNGYRSEIISLRSALEEQRSTLTFNFNNQVENLTNEYASKEATLKEGYEKQINELQSIINASREELSADFVEKMNELKSSHEIMLNETLAGNEARVTSLINEYEEKLSYTLIHSNSQNSKLNEELNRAQFNNDSSMEQIRTLGLNLEAKNVEIGSLTVQISALEQQLRTEAEKYLNLANEFEGFRQSASLSVSEQVAELNNQIAGLNLAHSDYVNELTLQMDSLNLELTNMGLLFEKTTNALGETESSLEAKTKELESARHEISTLQTNIAESEQQLEIFKTDLQNTALQQIRGKEVEFQKLLTENNNLIAEIDEAQDKVESLEAELELLKTEIEEVKMHSAGKAEDFKETLANKNFEITNLEANNAALNQELILVKQDLANVQNQLSSVTGSEEQMMELQQTIEKLNNEKVTLLVEIAALQLNIGNLNESVASLNETITGLNNKVAGYEGEIESLQSNSSKTAEQEAFIDRLFKQIDGLNDERLALLNEKEQMASQLLKMNDVVGSISQQIDSEMIDVTDLNNHRKNVILATNSGGPNENSQMKEQINDLVREIDKCIALLSA